MNDSEFNKELDRLVEISKRYGKNPGYALGGSGSLAKKQDDVLLIKDADKPLSDLTEIDFIRLDRNKLAAVINKSYPADAEKRDMAVASGINAAKLYKNDYRRAGVNALLHNLFNYKYTLHAHPVLIEVLGRAPKEAVRLTGGDLLWAPDCPAGYEQIIECRDLLKDYYRRTQKHAKIMLVQEHGVFVAGDTPEELDSQMLRVMSAVEALINGMPEHRLLEHDSRGIHNLMRDIARCYRKPVYAAFASNKRILKFIANDTGKRELCPAEGGCCTPMYVTVKDPAKLGEAFKSYVLSYKRLPRIFCIPNAGAVSVGVTKAECEQNMLNFTNYINGAAFKENFGGFLHMADNLISHILNYNTKGMGINSVER